MCSRSRKWLGEERVDRRERRERRRPATAEGWGNERGQRVPEGRAGARERVFDGSRSRAKQHGVLVIFVVGVLH